MNDIPLNNGPSVNEVPSVNDVPPVTDAPASPASPSSLSPTAATPQQQRRIRAENRGRIVKLYYPGRPTDGIGAICIAVSIPEGLQLSILGISGLLERTELQRLAQLVEAALDELATTGAVTAYSTHPLKAACQEKKLPRTPNRLRFFLQVFFGLTPHGRLGSDSSFTDGAEKAIRTAHPYVLITTNCTG